MTAPPAKADTTSHSDGPPSAAAADLPPGTGGPTETKGVGRAAWLALAVVLVAEVMDLLDTTIVGVASPAIRDELGGTYASIQWISAGYTLAFAVVLITGARLGDLYGRKRLFIIGLVGFTASSAACALAGSPGMLIGFRLVQGIFAALLIPQGFGLIRAAFPPDQIGKAFAAFGPVMGLSAVCGPIVGGALVDGDLFGTGWRMIFLINVPLGLAALVGAIFLLKSDPKTDHERAATRLDPLGAVLATVGAFLVVYPLVQGREQHWPAWIFGLLAAGVLMFVLLALHLRRAERRGGSPLVLPSLFAKRSFSGALVVGLLFFAAMAGLMLVLTLYLQIGLGYSPLRAGLTMAPWSLGIAIGAPISAALLAPRFGRLVVTAGALVMALGAAGTWLTLQLAGDSVTSWQFVPSLLVSGVGMGALIAPFFDIAMGDVSDAETGSASGLLNAIQQMGSSVGVAVLATIFVGLLGTAAAGSVTAVTPDVRAGLTAAGVPAAAQGEIIAGLRDCVHDRATADDPAAMPASCRSTGAVDPKVTATLTSAGVEASRQVFTTAAKRLLLVEVGLLVVLAALSFLLPKHARQGTTEH